MSYSRRTFLWQIAVLAALSRVGTRMFAASGNPLPGGKFIIPVYGSDRSDLTVGDRVTRLLTVTIAPVTPEDIPENHDVVIRGYDVTFAGRYERPGSRILVLANRVKFEKGTVFDLSGASASPILEKRAATPDGWGADGKDGLGGDSGRPAGALVVVAREVSGTAIVFVNGGHAGDGQDGGHGRTGAKGQDGKKESFNGDFPSGPPENGLKGQQGGAAGAGGNGGNGGDAGYAGCYFIGQLGKSPFDPKSTAMPGKAGKAGSPGDRGPGGVGGKRGSQGWEIHRGDGRD